jgi:Rha family phage regulatory protein
MSNPVIFFEDGIPKTTSLEVARIFGKSHKDVMKAIRNPIIPVDFSGRNFDLAEIIEKDASNLLINKSYYKLTRDGFNLIALGFTGGRAMQHKIAFIYAFNAVVDELARVKLQGLAPPLQLETAKQQDERLYQCAHCKEWLSIEAFNKDNHRKPSRQAWCRTCHKNRAKEMKLIEWTPEPRKMEPSGTMPESVTTTSTPVIPEKIPSNKVLALVRRNPPKSNQRAIPETELTEDKQMILRLVRSQREILDIIEARALGGANVNP